MMGRKILCTVGTSMLSEKHVVPPKRNRSIPAPTDRKNAMTDLNNFTAEQVTDLTKWKCRMKDCKNKYVQEFKRVLTNGESVHHTCAEIASNHFAGVGNDDEVHLLASDTPEGVFCAKVLEGFYAGRVKACQVHRIEGLKVERDPTGRENVAQTFETVGVRNLLLTILDILLANAAGSSQSLWDRLGNWFSQLFTRSDLPADLVNITGGWKSTVPYVALIAMALGRQSVYLYEDTDGIIKLPPLPLSLGDSTFDNHAVTLRLLFENGALETTQWSAWRDFDPQGCYISEENGQLRLTPGGMIGVVFMGRETARRAAGR